MTHTTMLILTVLLIPAFIPMIFIPYLTRKTESFGVSIPEHIYNTPELKSMRNKYAKQMSLISIMAIFIFSFIYFFISQEELLISIAYGVIIIAHLFSSFLIYLVFHKQMKQRKRSENWTKNKSEHVVVHTKFHDQKLTISNWLYIIPFTIVFLTIVFTFLFYQQIPGKIPIHYNFTGEVSKWAPKSYRSVLLLPLTQMFLIVTLIFTNIIIAKSKQQVSAESPEESMKRNVIFRRRWSLFIYITTILFTIMFSFFQLSLFININQAIMIIFPIFITFAIIVGAVFLAITTGQGGSRITLQTEINDTVIDRDDDQYWKLGQFYFNKDDPTLFLEKRFGIGWTINWARPTAWLSLLVIIGLAIIIPLLLSY